MFLTRSDFFPLFGINRIFRLGANKSPNKVYASDGNRYFGF
jgi:hypothetical protein